MAIIITDKEPDIYLTQYEHAYYLDQYRKDYMFFAGTPPSFESYVRAKLRDPEVKTIKIVVKK